MTAAALIEQADADGLKLWPNGGRMAYEGPPAVVERWKPILAANKPSILAELNARSPVDREASPIARRRPASGDGIAPPAPETPEPTRACSTCTHACRSGCCGDPVAAGLSDVEGVIRYHPDGGATCLAWLAMIPPDLEDLIRQAGVYWEYSPEDYDLIRETARRDPDGLRLALRDDPAFQPTQGRVTP